jgi:hypothetical protein
MKSYVYLYDNDSNDLFGVKSPMNEYDYELAPLKELINQEWANDSDEERVFVVAEGEFMFRNGKYLKL